MTTPREWKSEQVLKLSGSIVKEGVFHGHPGEDTTNPHALKPSKFTPELIEKAFKNISGPIPIYLTHDMKGQPRDQIGSTFHAGLAATKDDIEVKGMVWKDSAINRIKNESLNRFSPEFDFDYDAQGNIMNAKIVGLIPTNNPAISNTPIQAISTVFDQIGGSMTDQESAAAPAAPVQTTITQNGTGTYTAPSPVSTPPVAPVNNDNQAAVLAQLNAFAQQMAANQEVIKNLLAERDASKLVTVNTFLAELKTLGVNNPENMISGLPADSQLNVLKAVKENLSLRAPLVTPGSSGQNTGAPAQQIVENSILKEIGISRKEYDKLMSSPCPSLDKEE